MVSFQGAGRGAFPFLFGGTFIEADQQRDVVTATEDFPSFSEGLSLRNAAGIRKDPPTQFPFLFGGTFIEELIL